MDAVPKFLLDELPKLDRIGRRKHGPLEMNISKQTESPLRSAHQETYEVKERVGTPERERKIYVPAQPISSEEKQRSSSLTEIASELTNTLPPLRETTHVHSGSRLTLNVNDALNTDLHKKFQRRTTGLSHSLLNDSKSGSALDVHSSGSGQHIATTVRDSVIPMQTLNPMASSTRREAQALKQKLLETLLKIDSDAELRHKLWTKQRKIQGASLDIQTTDEDYQSFANLLQEEQFLYDEIYQEAIRQVSSHTTERGDCLNIIRTRYNTMFSKIPNQVKKIYQHSLANGRVIQRLMSDLLITVNVLAHGAKDLDKIRKKDRETEIRAMDIELVLMDILADLDLKEEWDNTQTNVIQVQKANLEKQCRDLEKDKDEWLIKAANLASALGGQIGYGSMLDLQREEATWFRCSNTIYRNIQTSSQKTLMSANEEFEKWRGRMAELSKATLDDDLIAQEHLSAMMAEAKELRREIDSVETKEVKLEAESPLMAPFFKNDSHHINECLKRWGELMGVIANRFVTERESLATRELEILKAVFGSWKIALTTLMARAPLASSKFDYEQLQENLDTIVARTKDWLNNMGTRICGGKGLAGAIINAHIQLEDRLAELHARDMSKPLSQPELSGLRFTLDKWRAEWEELLKIFMETVEEDAATIPGMLEQFLLRLSQQIRVDEASVYEEINSLHSAILGWIINFVNPPEKAGVEKTTAKNLDVIQDRLVRFTDRLLAEAGVQEIKTEYKEKVSDVIKAAQEAFVDISTKSLTSGKNYTIHRHGNKFFGKSIMPAVGRDELFMTSEEDQFLADLEKTLFKLFEQ